MFVVKITSIKDFVVSVILVGFLTSCCKLNVEIKVCSEVVSGSGAKRLQFRSPRMTTFKSRSNASVRLFARDSKHVVGVCGGRYVLQIKNDLSFLHSA